MSLWTWNSSWSDFFLGLSIIVIAGLIGRTYDRVRDIFDSVKTLNEGLDRIENRQLYEHVHKCANCDAWFPCFNEDCPWLGDRHFAPCWNCHLNEPWIKTK